MKYFNQAVKYGAQIARKPSTAAVTLMTGATMAHAELPAAVATSITAAQTDILAIIGLGFAFVGAVSGLWAVLGYLPRIIKKR